LRLWWCERLGIPWTPHPWEALAEWRWGPSASDPEPGIVIDRPDPARRRLALESSGTGPGDAFEGDPEEWGSRSAGGEPIPDPGPDPDAPYPPAWFAPDELPDFDDPRNLVPTHLVRESTGPEERAAIRAEAAGVDQPIEL
jgi:hypothetical protein